MILLPTALELPADQETWPRRTTFLAVSLAVLFSVEYLANTLVTLDQRHHWGLVPDMVFRLVTYLETTCSLYNDPALFSPWQLLTYVLVNDGLLATAVNVVMLVVVGRSVERWLGSAAFAAALTTLVPLAGVLHWMVGDNPNGFLTGADGLILGLLGMALLLFPRTRVHWGIAYFAVVVAGYLPLFRLALMWMIVLVLVLGAVAHRHEGPQDLLITEVCDLGALGAGVILGLTGRRLQQPPAHREA